MVIDDNGNDKRIMEIIFQARKRSYLVGSVGPTSLLGTQELERQTMDDIFVFLRIFMIVIIEFTIW